MAPPLKKPKIDEEQIEKLAMIMCTMPEIEAVSGVSMDILEARYSGIIEKGRNLGKASLRRKQYELAMQGNLGALIWLGKNILNQVDRTFAEIRAVGAMSPAQREVSQVGTKQLIDMLVTARDEISEVLPKTLVADSSPTEDT